MNREQFERELSRAQNLQKDEPSRADYWLGYERGLRRHFYGANFGSMAEHIFWVKSAESEEPERRQRGLGYVDGSKGMISQE